MEVRLARPDDAEAIRAIYNAEVSGSTVTFDIEPRTMAEQRGLDRAPPGRRTRPSWPWTDGVVAGFGSLSPFRDRAAYATTVEDSVYVDADWRGQGVGRLAARRARAPGRTRGFHTVIARTSGDNEPSIALHRGVRLRAWSASSGRWAGSSAAGSTWPSSSGCCEAAPSGRCQAPT